MTQKIPDADACSTFPMSRHALLATFCMVVIFQCLYLAWIGNGLGPLSDPYSEANVIRAVDGYVHDGLSSHHSLPRIAFGSLFPADGGIMDILDKEGEIKPELRQGFPPEMRHPDQWVYTHYPVGEALLATPLAKVAGLSRLWMLRLLPLAMSLLSVAVFFQVVTRAFGKERGAFVGIGCAILPMFNTYMPGLAYQGYSFALLLLQLSIAMHTFWVRGELRWKDALAIFLLGFVQGWLSFDQFFVVSLLPLPLYLLRRSEDGVFSRRALVLMVLLPFCGFALAHTLHFLRVSAELGGVHAALAEFTRTAGERASQSVGWGARIPPLLNRRSLSFLRPSDDGLNHLRNMVVAGYWCFAGMANPLRLQFSPLLPMAFLLALPAILRRSVTFGKSRSVSIFWPEKRSAVPAVAAAFVVSALWWWVMPGHTAGNYHFTVRHFFVFHFILLIVISKSVHRSKSSLESDPTGGPLGT